MTTITQQIDLQPFCDRNTDGRYSLHLPWVKDGRKYASDGRVLISVPAPGEPDYDANERRKLPRANEILSPVPADAQWLPWPSVETCQKCLGQVTITCQSCNGRGKCFCKCHGEHQCDTCDGEKTENCDKCGVVGSFPYRFGEVELAQRYAWLIASLPGPVEFIPGTEDGGKVFFRFAGGEGCVMGLRTN